MTRFFPPLSVTLALLAAVVATAAPSTIGTRFQREFAPEDALVAPTEKPYRAGVCLNGSWQFQPVALPSGFRPGRDAAPALPDPTDGSWDKTPIRIPSPWNANSFADQDGRAGDFRCFPSYPAAWNGVQMGWLRRTFSIPADWKGRRVLLRFDAVAGDTEVRINGKQVGKHFDLFLPFELDVTDAIHPGTNELLVGVRKASLFDVPGRYGRRMYQGGSMWGQHIAGIWQDVNLEAVPTVHVTDVFVKPQVDQDRLDAEVTLRNDTDLPVSVKVDGAVYPWRSRAGTDVLSAPESRWELGRSAALACGTESVSVPAHAAATVTVSGKVSGRLKLWSPDTPNLYGLVCRVHAAGRKATDAKYTRFGWRQVAFRGSTVLLNGQPLVMKGDSWHFIGIPEMTRRYAWAWYRALKDAHLNAVRLHAQPYPALFMDVADEMGLLVLDESAMWASDGGPKLDAPAYWTDSEVHLRELILRDRNHPSVFGWSVSNEIMPVIKNVFHAPQEMADQLLRYDRIWAEICRKNDPTRAWISADGEDDAAGALPTYVVHYGDASTFRRAAASGKPWGVGESGPAYYGTPQQVAQQSGDARAYLSLEDRMEGVAAVSYQNLVDQRKFNASYRSVFNLVWYALKPLELGLPDTTRPPTLADGVFFPPFVEGKPGVQPERLGPYCTTLNPGYDPRLPLYHTWPLFDAIQAAQAEPLAEYKPAHKFTLDAGKTRGPSTGTVKSVRVLSGSGGILAAALRNAGVPVSESTQAAPELLFVDGATPPGAEAVPVIKEALAAGGTVFVWGAQASTLPQLNALLPQRLELTERSASSLVAPTADPLVAGLTPAALYFSELNPSTILRSGLGGPLAEKGRTLLAACGTDWRRWNGQPEMTKTVMVLRSGRENKPSGAALVELSEGRGRWLVCNLNPTPESSKAASLNRALLANLGIALGEGAGQQNVLATNGAITGALALGRLPVASVEEGLRTNPVPPNSGGQIAAGASVNGRSWTAVPAAGGALDLRPIRGGRQQTILVYLSFWLYSPKALDNLLLDPHLPNLGLTITSAGAAQVWLNGKPLSADAGGGEARVRTLLLQQGWNHMLVKLVRSAEAGPGPALKLESSQPDYLAQMRGALERPQ